MKLTWRVILLLTVIKSTLTLINFCSMTCARSGCTGITPADCGGCQTNWIGGTSCVPNTALNWQYADKATDLGGTLTVSLPLANNLCGSYNIYGWSPSGTSNIISVSTPGIATGFYSMTIHFGVISTDVRKTSGGGCGGTCFWQLSTIFTHDFYAGGSLILSGTQRLSSKDKS